MLKVACSGPGVSRTRNLLVTCPILYQLDHCTHVLRKICRAFSTSRLSAASVLNVNVNIRESVHYHYFALAATLATLIVYVQTMQKVDATKTHRKELIKHACMKMKVVSVRKSCLRCPIQPEGTWIGDRQPPPGQNP